jgi:octopine/nopaline transport system substrate-binding protein
MSKLAFTAAMLVALPLVASPALAKEWTTLNVAMEGAFPPYNSVDSTGKIVGFEPELLDVICERAALKCQPVIQAWEGIIPGLVAGKYDAIMDGLSITPKRLEVIDFTRSYTNSPSTYAVLKTSPLTTALGPDKVVVLTNEAEGKASTAGDAKALADKTLAVQASSIQVDFAKTYLPDVKARAFETTQEEDLDLKSGRVDAVFGSAAALVSSIEQSNGDIVMAGPRYYGGLLGIGAGIGIPKGEPELKAKLDAAIKSCIADGTIKTLAEKWFHIDTTPQE